MAIGDTSGLVKSLLLSALMLPTTNPFSWMTLQGAERTCLSTMSVTSHPINSLALPNLKCFITRN